MKKISSLSELREISRSWHLQEEIIGLVPTMGALHVGHLSLVDLIKPHADKVITTIFVNPKQFNQSSDFENYPNTIDDDCALLEQKGVDLVFIPKAEDIYPQGYATNINVTGLSDGLCGAYRPGHFEGVATIVAKLFLMTAADKAIFGEKDWQQLQIIKRMAQDLNINIDILSAPTMREANGLAMSSRNKRLPEEMLQTAGKLSKILFETADLINQYPNQIEKQLLEAKEKIIASGFEKVEYLELCQSDNLQSCQQRLPHQDYRLLTAAWLSNIRLIDNIAV